MPDPAPSLEAALAYLRRHGEQYSREVLVEKLRQLGATEEVLDQAVQMYQEGRRQARARACWRALLGALLLTVLISVVLIGVAILLFIGYCPPYKS
jgi:hypothetical protein